MVIASLIAGLLTAKFIDLILELNKKENKNLQNTLSKKLENITKSHLFNAEQESEQVTEKILEPINVIFTNAKMNTKLFAEKVLGYRSQMILLLDQARKAADYEILKDFIIRGGVISILPPTDIFNLKERAFDLVLQEFKRRPKNEHEKFVRDEFRNLILNPDNLKNELERVIKIYLADIRNIENKLLVNLRADIVNLPFNSTIFMPDEIQFQKNYEKIIEQSITATGKNLREELLAVIVSEILERILKQLAIRLGIIEVSTSGGPAVTLAFLMIDFVAGLVWNWWTNPYDMLATDLNSKLNELNNNIVDELRSQLQQFSRERAQIRKQTVLSLIQQIEGGIK